MPARLLGHPCGLWPSLGACVKWGADLGSLGHVSNRMEGGGSGVEGQGATAVPLCLGILALAANFVVAQAGPSPAAALLVIESGEGRGVF